MQKLVLIFLFFSPLTFAKLPSMKLECGKIQSYTPLVERKFVTGIYNIDITYITKRPPAKIVDKALRDCIAASIKLDAEKDVLASAWFRPIKGAPEVDDEQINPYGGLKYISYTASKKSVDVHNLTLELRKK
jgi:hypothetical protein